MGNMAVKLSRFKQLTESKVHSLKTALKALFLY